MVIPQFKNSHLLRRALTHRSYLNENADVAADNERLEFLGDAVLDMVIAAQLYHRLPEMQEGRLTRLRAALVRTERLAAVARELDLGAQLFMGRGEEESGGRGRDSLLCDALEAVIGAYYLDSGLEAVRAFVEPLFQPLLEQVLRERADIDAKSLLQEWSQGQSGVAPHYVIVDGAGPDHERTFTAQVMLGDRVVGQGMGRNKRAAEQAAAVDAITRLGIA